jgi:uncharacterized protein DUF4440
MKVSKSLLAAALVMLCAGPLDLRAAESAPQGSEGEKLVRQLFSDMKAKNTAALEKWLAPGFQSLHEDGARNREEEMKLLKGLNLSDYTLSNFKVTQNGPVLIVTYSFSGEETVGGKRLSKRPSLRLTIFQKTDSGWQWLAHANLNPIK